MKESDFGPISDNVLAFDRRLRQITTRRRVLSVRAEIRIGSLTIRNLKLYCRIQIFGMLRLDSTARLLQCLLRFRRVRKIAKNGC